MGLIFAICTLLFLWLLGILLVHLVDSPSGLSEEDIALLEELENEMEHKSTGTSLPQTPKN